MPIRDLVVTAIVLGLLPFVFAHAYVGVLLWTWLSIMNPHKLAWGFAQNAPFAAMAAAVTLASLLTTRDKVRLPLDRQVIALIALVAWMCVTTAMAMDRGLSLIELERVLKIQLMTLVAVAVLHEKREIHLFVWVNVLSLGFFGLKGGIYTLVTGGSGRVWGPPGGFIQGNNELALALIMAIPLMYYLRLMTEKPWIRHGLVALMLFSALAALGSQSRGAFLAIAAIGAFLWWRSPYKLQFGIPLLIAAVALVVFMPDTWVARMQTIQTYQQDGSAMGRINAWITMVNIANDRLFGGGFEIYNKLVFQLYSPNPGLVKAAHSIYFQVLGEHGWIGLALFLGFWILVWRGAAALRRQAKGRDEFLWVYHLAGMCQVSLVGYAVGGAFLSLAYFDLPYNIFVVIVVTQRWLNLQLATREAATPAPSTAGTAALPRHGDARA
jgi:probable O-glycosylation ligase (exosortase A-associated)